MLIKDLKPISEKLYQAAVDQANHWGSMRHDCSTQEIPWSLGPWGDARFWREINRRDLDTARRIDKENGWGLFEEENPKFEIGEHAQIFKHRDVAGQRTAIFNDKVYRRNKAREWVISSQWDLKEAQWLIDRGFWIEINDRPEETESLAKKAVEVTEKEKAEFDKMTPAQQDAHIDKWAQDLADSMFNQSAINDGLPSDYVPPQEPRKAISYLYNDKQREEAERIDRARKRARFT